MNTINLSALNDLEISGGGKLLLKDNNNLNGYTDISNFIKYNDLRLYPEKIYTNINQSIVGGFNSVSAISGDASIVMGNAIFYDVGKSNAFGICFGYENTASYSGNIDESGCLPCTYGNSISGHLCKHHTAMDPTTNYKLNALTAIKNNNYTYPEQILVVGAKNLVMAQRSVAMNNENQVLGRDSIVAGSQNLCIANHSTTFGRGNISISQSAQMVFGRYNNPLSSDPLTENITKYLEIVGNGNNSENRNNARVLDIEGNQYLNGDLYINYNFNELTGISINNKIQELESKISQLETKILELENKHLS